MGYIETQPILTPSNFLYIIIAMRLSKEVLIFYSRFLVLILLRLGLFPIIALLIKLDSKGSVFFKQKIWIS